MKVFNALEYIKENGPIDPDSGICVNVTDKFIDIFWEWNNNKTSCFQDWDEFSGDNVYPVSGGEQFTPSHMFHRTSAEIMWNPEHPYGASRLRLLDHCIKWFKDRYI